MAKTRRQYAGAAAGTTLSGSINSSSTSINGVDLTGWPDGSVGPFYAVIGRTNGTEESILCVGRIGNTLTVATVPTIGRGQNDTAATSHSAGESLEHTWTKTDADDANEHYSASGAGGRDHTDLLNNTRHDVTARHTVGTVIPRGAPTNQALGDTAVTGATNTVADAGHKHGMPSMASILPPGLILPYSATAPGPPSGWLVCNGGTALKALYPNLYAAIGITYGPETGDSFTLPDLRGRTVIGVGAGPLLTNRTIGAQTGAEVHALVVEESPIHAHSIPQHSHTPDAGGNFITDGAGPPADIPLTGASYVKKTTTALSAATFTGNVGTNVPHNNMQPSIALHYLIKT